MGQTPLWRLLAPSAASVMQPGSYTVDLTNARPRERNSQGVRGRYKPVVPTLAYIQRKRASGNNPNARNARSTHPGPSLPLDASESSTEQRATPGNRGDTGKGNALDGQDGVTQEDRIDLLEFAALSTWSNVKQSPICQIDAPAVQLLGTSSMNYLFTHQDSRMDIDSPDQSLHELDRHARDVTPDAELTEFAALSHLPAIFGPIDHVPNHPSLPTADNG